MMIRAESPAKINRTLFILGERDDGYHELLTLFERIELCDLMDFHVENGSGRRVKIEGPDWFPETQDNLIYKAAMLFMESAGIDLSVEVNVEKQIPSGAGLGGGSSNAATTLRVLNSLCENEPLSREELFGLGARLGADVPFFLLDHPWAVGSGIGTRLEPLDRIKPYWYLLVFPGFSVSTAWAYSNFKLTKQRNKTIFDRPGLISGEIWCNDLEFSVIQGFPEIGKIKEKLLACGARTALMSGSGSTVFGVFDSMRSAQEAQVCLSTDWMNTRISKTMTRSAVLQI